MEASIETGLVGSWCGKDACKGQFRVATGIDHTLGVSANSGHICMACSYQAFRHTESAQRWPDSSRYS